MVSLVAYQNLYGTITPRRLDMVMARLGMDIAAPHMKKGRQPKFKDHLFVWARSTQQRSGRELLGVLKEWEAHFEGRDRKRG
jgi:hypothetical protein